MLLVGLTGGIGAGKSTVAAEFARLGARIIDADALARDAVAPGSEALHQLVAAFGQEIVLPDGSLNRPALGAIVFKDEQARLLLESIVHPAVRALSDAAIASYRASDPSGVVVYDIPLLVESKNAYDFDRIVVLSAPAAIRRARLIELRAMDPVEADRRIAAQATEDQRLAVATDVIDTGGSLADTLNQVQDVWHSLRETQGNI